MDPSTTLIPAAPLGGLLPVIVLAVAALAILLLDAFVDGLRRLLPWLTLGTLAVSTALSVRLLQVAPAQPFPGLYAADGFGYLFDILFSLAAMATVALSMYSLKELDRSEYYALLLLAVVGMSALAHANHLVTVFLGLELMSIVLYALTGFLTGRQRSAEAALKYFFLGAFASAFIVFGSALIYGSIGSFEFAHIAERLPSLMSSQGLPLALLAGVALVLVGFMFKISSVPFHMWTPDVYEGAPTPVAAFMSVSTKAAAFAALLRMFTGGLRGLQAEWVPVVAGIAVATMMVGNLVALRQSRLKRMLAYSSVAHAGYALIGLTAWDHGGLDATVLYLVAYAAMNLGAFGIVAVLERDGEGLALSDLDGLAEQRPWAAAAMTLFMLSLAGVPPTAGFVGKFSLFMAAVDAGWTKLAVLAVLYSAMAAYYYLRVIVHMYMEPVRDGRAPLRGFAATGTVIVGMAVVAVAFIGVAPGRLLAVVEYAVKSLS